MSAGDAFFDSNILVYLTDSESGKAGATEDLLARGGTVSVQVLNEFASVALRKLLLTWAETRDLLDTFRATLNVVPLTLDVHDRGLAIAERYQLNVYDGMIVAAAQLAGCATLYSEDMQNGLVIDGLTVRNPYATTAG